jgi:hypothetical protein
MIEQMTLSEPFPRNAMLVALEIGQMIPEDKTDFYKDIEDLIRNDYVYKDYTSLQTPYSWQKLEFIMHRYIPLVDEEWKQKIVNVYIGKTKS